MPLLLLLAVAFGSPILGQTVGVVAPPELEEVAALVEVELAAAGFPLVDRRKVAALLDERRMSWTGLSAAEVHGLGTLGGAHALLWLEPTEQGQHRFRLIDVRRGLVLRTGSRPTEADETAAMHLVASLDAALRAIGELKGDSRLVALAPIRVVGASPEGLDLAARARRFLVDDLSRRQGLILVERENFDNVRIERAASDETTSLVTGEVLLEGTLEVIATGRWSIRIGATTGDDLGAAVTEQVDLLQPAEGLRRVATRIADHLRSSGLRESGVIEEGAALAQRVKWLIRAGLHREASEALELLETLRPEDPEVVMLRFEAGNKLLAEPLQRVPVTERVAFATRHFHFVTRCTDVIRDGFGGRTSWFGHAVEVLGRADLFASFTSSAVDESDMYRIAPEAFLAFREASFKLGESLWDARPNGDESTAVADLLRISRRFALIFSRDRREFVPALEGILASDDRLHAIYSLMFTVGEADVAAAAGRPGELPQVAFRREAARLLFATTRESAEASLERLHARAWEARAWIAGGPAEERWPRVRAGAGGPLAAGRPAGAQEAVVPQPELLVWILARQPLGPRHRSWIEDSMAEPTARSRMIEALGQAKVGASPDQLVNLRALERVLGIETPATGTGEVLRSRLRWLVADHLGGLGGQGSPDSFEKVTYLPGMVVVATQQALFRVVLPSLATTRFTTPRDLCRVPDAVHADRRSAFVFGEKTNGTTGVYRLDFATGSWTFAASPSGLPLRSELAERTYLPGTDSVLFVPRRVSNSTSEVASGIQVLDKRTLESTWLVHGLRRPAATPMDLPGNLFDVVLTEDPSRVIVTAARVGSGTRAYAHEVHLDSGNWRRLDTEEWNSLRSRPRIWEFPPVITSENARLLPEQDSVEFRSGGTNSGPRIEVHSAGTIRSIPVILEGPPGRLAPPGGKDGDRRAPLLEGTIRSGLFIPEGLLVTIHGGFHLIPRNDILAVLGPLENSEAAGEASPNRIEAP